VLGTGVVRIAPPPGVDVGTMACGDLFQRARQCAVDLFLARL
jgi:hypothetical protein